MSDAGGGDVEPGTALPTEAEEMPPEATAAVQGAEEDSNPHFLPPFANEYNKEVSRRVKAKEDRQVTVAADVDDQSERIRVMDEHLGNVKQELVHTQALVDAKSKEIETEQHLRQLSEREGGRLVQELKRIEVEKAELQERLNAVQTAIFQGNERMDSFRKMMNWNQEELEQWALAAAQKEEDNLALLKYTRADEAKIKELNLNLEKLTKVLDGRKQVLEEEVTETQAKQIELDKTAEDFKSLHAERQNLVTQWEQTIASMAVRDDNIKAAGEKYAAVRSQVKVTEDEIAERRKFLENEQKNNEQTQAQITERERSAAQAREELRYHSEQVDHLEDQVLLAQTELQKATTDLEKYKVSSRNEAQMIDVYAAKMESLRQQEVQVKEKVAGEHVVVTELGEIAGQKEQARLAEVKRLKALDDEIAAMRNTIFKQSQELWKQRKEESNLLGEISGAETAKKNLQATINRLDAQSLTQQEHVYTAEFQIQLLERKVRRAEGERTESETKDLNDKIEALNQELDDKAAQGALLDKQTKKLNNDLKAAKRKAVEQAAQEAKLTEEVDELGLENDTIERNIETFVKRKEEVTVQHDVLKLEVRRVRDVLNQRADEVFGLENRKAQLQLSMEEREREIAVHTQTLRAELKLGEEDRSKVAKELKERMLKIETLKKKYDVLCGRMSGGEGGEGEHTQAFYVIQAAQKREELQREGDALDAKIRKAEKEVRTLEKAMGKLYAANQGLKGSFAKVDTSSKEFIQMQKLEKKFEGAMDKRKYMRREKESLESDLSSMQQKLASLKLEQGALQQSADELEKSIDRQGAEVTEQVPRLEHANAAAAAAAAAVRETLGVGADEMSVADREVGLLELREGNRHALQCVVELVGAGFSV
jgi:chromosome segregation ATPase|eukprot:COSAG01_NODE_1302_length_10819_cov_17.534515_3_plen_882_part_00